MSPMGRTASYSRASQSFDHQFEDSLWVNFISGDARKRDLAWQPKKNLLDPKEKNGLKEMVEADSCTLWSIEQIYCPNTVLKNSKKALL